MLRERFIPSQHVWCSPWYLQEVCPGSHCCQQSLMSYPFMHPLIPVLSICNWSKVLRQHWTMVSQPWGGNRRNVISPWILHPLLSLQEGCTPWLLSAWGSPPFLLAVHPGDSQHTLLPPPTCIPVHSLCNSATFYTWRKGASLYFPAQRFSTSNSSCQEQLCSLPHQSSWLHHM